MLYRIILTKDNEQKESVCCCSNRRILKLKIKEFENDDYKVKKKKLAEV